MSNNWWTEFYGSEINVVARTNPNAVQTLLRSGAADSDYDGVSSLTPHIDTANVIVTRVNTCAVSKGITLSSTELELIERWLAAHSYVMSDQTYASKKTGERSAVFHGKTGMSLEATKYGQMALTLDISGCLKAISRGIRQEVVWLGKAPSDQIDYSDRD